MTKPVQKEPSLDSVSEEQKREDTDPVNLHLHPSTIEDLTSKYKYLNSALRLNVFINLSLRSEVISLKLPTL